MLQKLRRKEQRLMEREIFLFLHSDILFLGFCMFKLGHLLACSKDTPVYERPHFA
jgi:hypothetical protein